MIDNAFRLQEKLKLTNPMDLERPQILLSSAEKKLKQGFSSSTFLTKLFFGKQCTEVLYSEVISENGMEVERKGKSTEVSHFNILYLDVKNKELYEALEESLVTEVENYKTPNVLLLFVIIRVQL
jgi:hypothetical protein